MKRRDAMLGLGAVAVGTQIFVQANSAVAQEHDHKHGKHFALCAAECAKCMSECEECYQHCSHLVIRGNTKHAACMQLCNDCAEICAVASRISSRQGPLVAAICEACAKACDACAAECEKFKDDAHMSECAAQCRACAESCREMLKHV